MLIHGGDFTQSGELSIIKDLDSYFRELQKDNVVKKVVCIAGNHDGVTLEKNAALNQHGHTLEFHEECKSWLLNKKFTYLEDESTNIMGLNIHGSPWYIQTYYKQTPTYLSFS